MASEYMGFQTTEDAPKGAPTQEYIDQFLQNKPAEAEQAPVAEPEKTPAAVVETPTEATPEAPKEIIKEVIVEKYPELTDDQKWLLESIQHDKEDDIYNYLSEKKKDYKTMADIDVIREDLKKTNPKWSSADVELEIRAVYGKQLEKYDLTKIDKEENPDEYAQAEAHNERADENLLRLQRAARDSRVKLTEQQKSIKLPKIEQPKADAPVADPKEAEERLKKWAEQAEQQVPAMSDFKFSVGDAKNPEEVVFKITEDDKKSRVDAMKTWNGADFMAKHKWQNEDGSFNLQRIAEDVHFLENKDKIIKAIYNQAKEGSIKDIKAEIKNIDLTPSPQPDTIPAQQSVGSLVWG